MAEAEEGEGNEEEEEDGPVGGEVVLAPRAGRQYDVGTVLSRGAGGTTRVRWRNDGTEDTLPPRTPLVGAGAACTGVPDMADAAFVYEAAVFVNLRTRCARREMYTWIGPMLVSLWGGRGGEGGAALLSATPHPHTLAARALLGAVAAPTLLQSVVPSGAAGSGKSFAARQMLEFLVDVACTPPPRPQQQPKSGRAPAHLFA